MPALSNGVAHEDDAVFIRGRWAELGVGFFEAGQPGKIIEHLAVVCAPEFVVCMPRWRQSHRGVLNTTGLVPGSWQRMAAADKIPASAIEYSRLRRFIKVSPELSMVAAGHSKTRKIGAFAL